MPGETVSRKVVRRGSVSAALAALVVLSAMLLNAILTALAMRYGWFVNLNPPAVYPVTDACLAYLDEYVMPAAARKGERIRLLFCDEEENVRASDTQAVILRTALELRDRYPETVEVGFLNVWERPSIARGYGVKASTSVVVACGDESRVCKLTDFFVFPGDRKDRPVAYGGDKRFAVAMKAVVSRDEPVAYFTLNHGESFSDYALLSAVTDAGYLVSYLDAASFDIPKDCALLVAYNPIRDFTEADGVSGISEIGRLRDYLRAGGRFMMFASADTFAAGRYENLEGLLAEWGVRFTHRKGLGGVEECFAVRDAAHALTTDGYTFLGQVPADGAGGRIMRRVDGPVRVANATGLSAAEGYAPDGHGDFAAGTRRMTVLLRSHGGAEAWVGGRAADRAADGYPLVALTTDSQGGGSVLASSSLEIAAEESLTSVAFDNQAFLLTALGAMGKSDVPVRLTVQPFADDRIRALTTVKARAATVVLTVVPVAASLACGCVALVRRRFS